MKFRPTNGTVAHALASLIHAFYYSHATPNLILFSGMMAGIISKTAVYPLDLCKKRMQIQKFQQSRTTYGENFVCNGMFDCIKKTLKREGWNGELSKT